MLPTCAKREKNTKFDGQPPQQLQRGTTWAKRETNTKHDGQLLQQPHRGTMGISSKSVLAESDIVNMHLVIRFSANANMNVLLGEDTQHGTAMFQAN